MPSLKRPSLPRPSPSPHARTRGYRGDGVDVECRGCCVCTVPRRYSKHARPWPVVLTLTGPTTSGLTEHSMLTIKPQCSLACSLLFLAAPPLSVVVQTYPVVGAVCAALCFTTYASVRAVTISPDAHWTKTERCSQPYERVEQAKEGEVWAATMKVCVMCVCACVQATVCTLASHKSPHYLEAACSPLVRACVSSQTKSRWNRPGLDVGAVSVFESWLKPDKAEGVAKVHGPTPPMQSQ